MADIEANSKSTAFVCNLGVMNQEERALENCRQAYRSLRDLYEALSPEEQKTYEAEVRRLEALEK